MAPIREDTKARLLERGVASHHAPPFWLPDACAFEPPCHLGRLGVERGLNLGAFSCAASGYVFHGEVGRYCSLDENVQIGRRDHPDAWGALTPTLYGDYRAALNWEEPRAEAWRLDPGRPAPPPPYPPEGAPVRIGADVAVGFGAVVMAGVRVGDGAVVRPMAVVTEDVPPYAVVAGSPARVIEMRFPEPLVRRFLDLRWWRYALWDLDRAAVTDPAAFLDRLEARIADGLAEYRPSLVAVADL